MTCDFNSRKGWLLSDIGNCNFDCMPDADKLAFEGGSSNTHITFVMRVRSTI